MFPTPDPWSALTAALKQTVPMLALETSLLVLLAMLVVRFTRPGGDRRLVYRLLMVALLLVTLVELTGITSLLAPRQEWEAAVFRRLDPLPVAPARMLVGQLDPTATTLTAVAVEPPSAPSFVPWAGLLWITGTFVLLAVILGAHLLLAVYRRRLQPVGSKYEPQRLRELVDLARAPSHLNVGQRPGILGPFVFGLLRPTLVLPTSLPDNLEAEHRDAILLHELAHLAGRDPWWQLLADVVTALLWWNPLVWYARSALGRAAEETADDAVLLLPDGGLLLAESLVALGRQALRPRLPVGFAAQGARTWLARRVLRLLERPATPQTSAWSRWGRAVLPVAVIITVMVGTGAARPPVSEDAVMSWKQRIGQSVLGLALLSWGGADANAQAMAEGPGPAAGQAARGKVRDMSPAGKSEAHAAVAMGLSAEQHKKYDALLAERAKALKEFQQLPMSPEKITTGRELGDAWRGGLKEIVTPEQYSRYVEYWLTNSISIKWGAGGQGSGDYTLVLSSHPFDEATKLTESLKLSEEQARKVQSLRTNLTAELRKLEAKVQKPVFDEFGPGLAQLQKQRNDRLKQLLSADQYTQYRVMVDEFSTQPSAARVFSGAVAAPPDR